MNSKQQAHLFEQFTGAQRKIFVSKADDYAGSEDRLNNFKVVGAILGMSAEDACMVLIATKVARLGSLLKDGRTPNNESIDDSIIDLANYTFLLQCLRSENDPAFKASATFEDIKDLANGSPLYNSALDGEIVPGQEVECINSDTYTEGAGIKIGDKLLVTNIGVDGHRDKTIHLFGKPYAQYAKNFKPTGNIPAPFIAGSTQQ